MQKAVRTNVWRMTNGEQENLSAKRQAPAHISLVKLQQMLYNHANIKHSY